nr:MAG TPA: hypothetical protein [Caudoviricetes sp.]
MTFLSIHTYCYQLCCSCQALRSFQQFELLFDTSLEVKHLIYAAIAMGIVK